MGFVHHHLSHSRQLHFLWTHLTDLDPDHPPGVWWDRLVYLGAVQYIVRLVVMALMLHYFHPSDTMPLWYLGQDPLMGLSYRLSFTSPLIYLVVLSVLLFILATHHRMYFRYDRQMARQLHWSINRDVRCLTGGYHLSVGRLLRQPITVCAELFSTCKHLILKKDPNLARLHGLPNHPTSAWPTLTFEDRLWLVRLWAGAHVITLLGVVTLDLIVLVLFMQHYSHHSKHPVLVLELLTILTGLLTGVKVCASNLVVSVVSSVASLIEYRHIRHQAVWMTNCERTARRRSLVISHLHRWHTRVTVLLANYNHRVGSPLSYLYLMQQLLLNSYPIIYLYRSQHLNPSIRASIAFFILAMFTFPFVGYVAGIRLNRAIYWMVPLMHRWLVPSTHKLGKEKVRPIHHSKNVNHNELNTTIDSRLFLKAVVLRQMALQTRVKLATQWYEQLHRKQRTPLMLTAGPLGSITTRTLADLVIINVGFVLFFIAHYV